MSIPEPRPDPWIRRYLCDVGRKIHERRMALGLTQGQLAAHLAWSRPKVAAIESCKQALTVEQLVLLACALRTDPWSLLPFALFTKQEAATADKLKAVPHRKRPRKRRVLRPS